MKTSCFLTFVFILSVGSCTVGQTRMEFENALGIGGSSKVFRDAELEPKFGRGGQLCRLRLLPRADERKRSNSARVSGETTYQVLELLIPDNKRGSRTSNRGIGSFFGQSYGIPYEFENVTVAVSGRIGRRGKNTGIFEPDNNPIFPSGEQVTFTWKNRKCS